VVTRLPHAVEFAILERVGHLAGVAGDLREVVLPVADHEHVFDLVGAAPEHQHRVDGTEVIADVEKLGHPKTPIAKRRKALPHLAMERPRRGDASTESLLAQ
jgi:hypothetical protein